ncbi:MAG: TMEM175 family protein [Candidatus Omnitrophota bacterium]
MSRFGEYFMEKNRIETLVDGIFAIVMTLLVMTVVVPQRETVIHGEGFMMMMRLKIHDIVNYALSFALLAIFWIQHHEQAHFIKRTDRAHIWINILMLFFIALFPFSTSLVTEFPDQDLAEILFGANLFIVGLLFLVNWTYATGGHRLVDPEIGGSNVAFGRNKCLLFMGVAAVAMILSQVNPWISADIFWIIPLLALFEHFFRRKAKAA